MQSQLHFISATAPNRAQREAAFDRQLRLQVAGFLLRTAYSHRHAVGVRWLLRRWGWNVGVARAAESEEKISSLQDSLVIAERKLRRSAVKAQSMTEQMEEGYQVVLESLRQGHSADLEAAFCDALAFPNFDTPNLQP